MRNERIVPRMRTIGEAIAEIRQADPGTAFTERALRRLVVSGAVPSVKVGQNGKPFRGTGLKYQKTNFHLYKTRQA